MTSDFQPPPKLFSITAVVGGIATAVMAIAGLEYCFDHSQSSFLPNPQVSKSLTAASKQSVAQIDEKSVTIPGHPVTKEQIAAGQTAYVAADEMAALTPEDIEIARQAWVYFQHNWNDKTGLVNSVDRFASVTLWDQATAIAALVSAKELNLIPAAKFEAKMRRMLQVLATMPLYRGELPNKVYNTKTLMPVNYGQLDKREEIGWSALDLGRMAIWLKIVGAKYPQLQPLSQAVWEHWQVKRLTKNGQMYGTSVAQGQEQYNQEGRLGYENYAAYGLKLWGLKVDRALDHHSDVAFVNLYGQGIPYDQRDYKTSGAHNYVLSEPYILDGIETGFQSLPKAYADRILAAQEARYQATNQLTAITEDNLDRPPYFVYNTLFVNGEPWATITTTNQKHNDLRFLSAKAVLGWHVLYKTAYTRQLFEFVQNKLKSKRGFYNGFYESLQQPNKALTANNNGVILEALFYKKIRKPLTVWAGISSSQ